MRRGRDKDECGIHFVDGKIVEDWYTTDVMAWVQQLGLMPPPK